MSKHWVEYKRYISKAYISADFHLDPEDFLSCEDEDELRDALFEEIYMDIDTGDVCIDESESEFEMEDFLKEWKSLKGIK